MRERATPRTVVIFTERVTSYGRALFAGMAAYAVEHGPWRFVPVQTPSSVMAETLRSIGADGAIVRVVTRTMARALLESGVPSVNVGLVRDFDLPGVGLDEVEVGRAAAQYLLSENLPSFAYCGFPWLWYSPPRGKGFAQAIAAAGIACATFGGNTAYPEADGAGAGGRDRALNDRQLQAWLASLPTPVGLMACDDARARQAAEACARAKLRVPEDVAIVGAGNDPMICEMSDPPLSSVALAAERVGFEAARLLAHLMDGGAPSPQPKVMPPAGMVVRFSTHVPQSTGDADLAQAISFIRDQVHAGITVDDVLRVVPLSRRTLEMRFRNTLSRSPAEEIRRVRIERAKRLLVETDAGMSGVARASGFSSANQLCETFRRETGVSPTKYRRQFRAG